MVRGRISWKRPNWIDLLPPCNLGKRQLRDLLTFQLAQVLYRSLWVRYPGQVEERKVWRRGV